MPSHFLDYHANTQNASDAGNTRQIQKKRTTHGLARGKRAKWYGSTYTYLKEALLDTAGVTDRELGRAPPNRHFLKSVYETYAGKPTRTKRDAAGRGRHPTKTVQSSSGGSKTRQRIAKRVKCACVPCTRQCVRRVL